MLWCGSVAMQGREGGCIPWRGRGVLLWCTYLQSEGDLDPERGVCTGENGISYVTSFKKRKKLCMLLGCCMWK